MKTGRAVGLIAACLLGTGCFDIEQTLSLDKNLGGKAGLNVGIDFEPMIYMMAAMQRGFAGKEGPPTKEELAAAKKDFLTKKTDEPSQRPDPKQIEADAKKSLPPGVKLLDSSFDDQGTKLKFHFLFGFDNVSKLAALHLNSKDSPSGPPGTKNPVESPFADLQIVDEGKTLLLTTKPSSPLDKEKDEKAEGGEGGEAAGSPEMDEQVRQIFKGFRVAYRIEAPFQVVESNATRVEGKTLIWEYKLEDFERMEKEAKAHPGKAKPEIGVRVRYRK
ncbi:MAG TPA: hypothetical protein VN783_06585 [Thermoanaerobaculia bacterium]|nr:hypothetical protein [Thermoanaerobaculia bacterium]